MCLGVPMRIIEIDGFNARCEARGIERKASLFLLQHEDLQIASYNSKNRMILTKVNKIGQDMN